MNTEFLARRYHDLGECARIDREEQITIMEQLRDKGGYTNEKIGDLLGITKQTVGEVFKRRAGKVSLTSRQQGSKIQPKKKEGQNGTRATKRSRR